MKRPPRDSNEPFILTAFDKYRAGLLNSFLFFALIIVFDILVGLLRPEAFAGAQNHSFLILLIATLVSFGVLLFSAVLYHKKQKEELKVVLRIDADGIYMSFSEQFLNKPREFAWKQIKTVYLRNRGRHDTYLTIEKNNGERIDFSLLSYGDSFSLNGLKSSLIHFAAGKAEVKIKILQTRSRSV